MSVILALVVGFIIAGMVVIATVPAVRGQLYTWWGKVLDLARRNGWGG